MERAEAETETKGAGAATSSNTNRRQLIRRVIHLALGGGSIPLIVLGAQSVCPAIPSMKAFLITFGVIIAMGAILKFASNYPPGNLDLEGQKKFKEEHPVLNLVIKVLEFLQLRYPLEFGDLSSSCPISTCPVVSAYRTTRRCAPRAPRVQWSWRPSLAL